MRAVEPCKLFLLRRNPTAEVLSEYLLTVVCPEQLHPLGVTCPRVELWETPNCRAVASV